MSRGGGEKICAKKSRVKFGKLSPKPETLGVVSVRNGKYAQITQSKADFNRAFYRWLLGPHACLAGI